MADNGFPIDPANLDDKTPLEHREEIKTFVNEIKEAKKEKRTLSIRYANSQEHRENRKGGFTLNCEFEPNEGKPILFIDFIQDNGIPGDALAKSVRAYSLLAQDYKDIFPDQPVVMFFYTRGMAIPGADAMDSVFTPKDGNEDTFMGVLRQPNHRVFICGVTSRLMKFAIDSAARLGGIKARLKYIDDDSKETRDRIKVEMKHLARGEQN